MIASPSASAAERRDQRHRYSPINPLTGAVPHWRTSRHNRPEPGVVPNARGEGYSRGVTGASPKFGRWWRRETNTAPRSTSRRGPASFASMSPGESRCRSRRWPRPGQGQAETGNPRGVVVRKCSRMRLSENREVRQPGPTSSRNFCERGQPVRRGRPCATRGEGWFRETGPSSGCSPVSESWRGERQGTQSQDFPHGARRTHRAVAQDRRALRSRWRNRSNGSNGVGPCIRMRGPGTVRFLAVDQVTHHVEALHPGGPAARPRWRRPSTKQVEHHGRPPARRGPSRSSTAAVMAPRCSTTGRTATGVAARPVAAGATMAWTR
jgi:hypothetical protein